MGDDNKGTKVTKVIEHPLEGFFDIEPSSTEVEVFERKDVDIVESEGYDEKDKEIEEQFEEIYISAMEGHDTLSEELHTVEGKYKARIGEVSVQHLNAALSAVSHKAKLKEHKDKLEVKVKAPASSVTTNNTLMVTDRNAFMAEMQKKIDRKAADEE